MEAPLLALPAAAAGAAVHEQVYDDSRGCHKCPWDLGGV
jgi:hypothetical protein